MTRVYRIPRKPYAKKPLDGEGAYRFAGRWSSVGTRLAYTAEHFSLAMIEYFIHIDPDDPPKDLLAVAAEVRSGQRLKGLNCPKAVAKKLAPESITAELAEIGDRFVRYARAAVLVVPSALAPAESNWLINPQHPESSRIRLHSVEAFEYDSRFFK